MAKRTKADAARPLGIARTILSKFIDHGQLSATPDGLIDETSIRHSLRRRYGLVSNHQREKR